MILADDWIGTFSHFLFFFLFHFRFYWNGYWFFFSSTNIQFKCVNHSNSIVFKHLPFWFYDVVFVHKSNVWMMFRLWNSSFEIKYLKRLYMLLQLIFIDWMALCAFLVYAEVIIEIHTVNAVQKSAHRLPSDHNAH